MFRIREFSASTFCVHGHVAYFIKRVLNIVSLNFQIIGANQFFTEETQENVRGGEVAGVQLAY